MLEQQGRFEFGHVHSTAPAVVPDLQDEIARAWGLPLGQRVEISLRGSDRSLLVGVLELVSCPAYPWDPHERLKLRISGFAFSNREIARWVLT